MVVPNTSYETILVVVLFNQYLCFEEHYRTTEAATKADKLRLRMADFSAVWSSHGLFDQRYATGSTALPTLPFVSSLLDYSHDFVARNDMNSSPCLHTWLDKHPRLW